MTIDDADGAEYDPEQLPARLRAGQSMTVHAACNASGPAMTSWRASSAGGRLIGYIAIDTPRKTDGLVFRVSRASQDRLTATLSDPP